MLAILWYANTCLIFFIGGVEECKTKWSSIRDQLRRTLQKRKTASSHRKYKYEDLLKFLLPYVTDRETFSHFSNLEEGNVEEVSNQASVDENFIDEQVQVEEEDNQSSTYQSNIFGPSSLKRKAESEESPSSQLMAYILAEKEREKQKLARLQMHPVDAFLAGIAPTLKSLNPILLNEAKTHIFSIVQEFELKQLTNS